jgi:hypothetical protein
MRQLRVTGIGRPMPARRLTARHMAKPHSGGEALGPENLKRGRRLKSQPTGGSAEQATHTARGTPGNRSGLAALPDFGKPRCREAPGSTGPSGPGVPRALGLPGAPPRITARPRRKEQGRRSVGLRHSGARAKRANPESITTSGAIMDRQGLWIPALASLGRNDKKGEREKKLDV